MAVKSHSAQTQPYGDEVYNLYRGILSWEREKALKVLISIAATSEYKDICLMHNDVSRAYFRAEAIRPVYVDIIDEYWSPGDENSCGKVNLSMYGTPDAATNWEAAYQKQMKAMQFEIGRASPCLF